MMSRLQDPHKGLRQGLRDDGNATGAGSPPLDDGVGGRGSSARRISSFCGKFFRSMKRLAAEARAHSRSSREASARTPPILAAPIVTPHPQRCALTSKASPR